MDVQPWLGKATVRFSRDDDIWMGLLGPMRIVRENTEVPVPAGRQRSLLAVLLLQANQAVSVDRLAAVLWDGNPPAGASATIRSYVKRLRQVLGPQLGARVVTRYPGYLIKIGEDQLDVLRFAALYRAGRSATYRKRRQEAFDLLSDSLALWRGAPLADVAAPALQREEVPQLEEMRLQAIEWRCEAALSLDRHDEVAAELRALVKQHPLREHFHAQLMLALARCGRRAEALASYQQVRRLLIEELGIEPGHSLQEAHLAILRGNLAAVPKAADGNDGIVRATARFGRPVAGGPRNATKAARAIHGSTMTGRYGMAVVPSLWHPRGVWRGSHAGPGPLRRAVNELPWGIRFRHGPTTPAKRAGPRAVGNKMRRPDRRPVYFATLDGVQSKDGGHAGREVSGNLRYLAAGADAGHVHDALG